MTLSERIEDPDAGLVAEIVPLARVSEAQLRARGIVSVEQLIEVVSDPKADLVARRASYRLLEWLRIREAVPALAGVLANEADDFTWAAVNALVRLRAVETVPTILEVLQLGSAAKQTAAAWALGWLRGAAAIEPLRAVARDAGRTEDVRGHAIEALGVLVATQAVPDLIALLDDSSPEVRYWSAYSLGQMSDPAAVPALERMAVSDTAVLSGNRSLRQEALEAIETIRAGWHRGAES